MKAQVLIMLVLSIYASLFLEPKLQGNMGQSCSLFPLLSISNFTVSPWPVTASMKLSCNMVGILKENEVIGDLILGQNYKNTWDYTNITVNAAYTKGQTFNYTFNVLAGSQPGTYEEQVTVRVNVTQDSICCWQFSYII